MTQVSGPGKAHTAFHEWLAALKRWPAAGEELRKMLCDGSFLDVAMSGSSGVSADAVRGLMGDPTFQAKLLASSAAEFVPVPNHILSLGVSLSSSSR